MVIVFSYCSREYRRYSNKKLSEEELNLCRNKECLFTFEPIENIPKEKLIMINEYNGLYDCFDLLSIRQLLFQQKNNVYLNPYTRTEINKEDINKILNINIKRIKYFCDIL